MQKITSIQYQDLIWLLFLAKVIYSGNVSPVSGNTENGGMVEDTLIFRSKDEAQF